MLGVSWRMWDFVSSADAHCVLSAGGAIVTLFSMASCSPGTSSAVDGSAPDAPGSFQATGFDGSADGELFVPPTSWEQGYGLDATNLDAPGPDPAPVACGNDAPEAGFCPMPPSVCADRSWLLFYDRPQCVSGSCTWEKRYISCSAGCVVVQSDGTTPIHGFCQTSITF